MVIQKGNNNNKKPVKKYLFRYFLFVVFSYCNFYDFRYMEI